MSQESLVRGLYAAHFHVKLADHHASKKRRASGSAGTAGAYTTPSSTARTQSITQTR